MRLVALVVLGSEDEVTFREPVDLVRVDRHTHLAPREKNVWMMPFRMATP